MRRIYNLDGCSTSCPISMCHSNDIISYGEIQEITTTTTKKKRQENSKTDETAHRVLKVVSHRFFFAFSHRSENEVADSSFVIADKNGNIELY